ncbi:cytochrome [Streptomyces yokosukanensis]|uniref:Cytochrome n=1 Tax=Streptomyces yokosukanensis TaxID=67386 RepID=A0A101NUI5_9ACTN|nr:cytochrome P450 [Streptomyces yokosukanensis]KUM99613.1 cytochrome [Streptomyces yokosukanensis]
MSPAGWAALAAGLAGAASLPYWLPDSVVALRVRIFAWVNGQEGVTAPGHEVPAKEFKTVYGHPRADGRSRGAALSDLFWYWLSPGPEVHQEHLEPGPRYDDVARTTRQILAGLTRRQWTELVARCTGHVLDELTRGDGPARVRHVRLRDLMMPVWAETYYEVVFREPCPRPVRDLITGNADDVVSALKCTRLRHMDRRLRLTSYLEHRLAHDPPPVPLPATLTPREQAYYLQGTFFNTAVVQMSEAMAHLLLALATHQEVQDRVRSGATDPDFLDHVIDETLFHFPLFGVAHRITTGDIPRDGGPPVPAGSVLLFNYPEYHRSGTDDARSFDPGRWLSADTRPTAYIPFGVAANRPCPARGFAVVTMRVAAEEVLRRFRPVSAVEHTRSLPSRGPCLLVPDRSPATGGSGRRLRARLAAQRIADRWAALPRSLTQLVLGSYMVWDARRQGLCRNHFATRSGGTTPSVVGGHRGGPRT